MTVRSGRRDPFGRAGNWVAGPYSTDPLDSFHRRRGNHLTPRGRFDTREMSQNPGSVADIGASPVFGCAAIPTVPPSAADDVAAFGQTATCGGLPPDRDLRVRCPHSCCPCHESAIRRPRLRCRGESHGLRMWRRGLRTARSPGSRDPVRHGHRVLACSRKANGPRSPRATWGTTLTQGVEARVTRRLVDADRPEGALRRRLGPPWGYHVPPGAGRDQAPSFLSRPMNHGQASASPRTFRLGGVATSALDCEAVLFDLDGVLVDSTESIRSVLVEWSSARGVDADELLRASHGRRFVDSLRQVESNPRLPGLAGERPRRGARHSGTHRGRW